MTRSVRLTTGDFLKTKFPNMTTRFTLPLLPRLMILGAAALFSLQVNNLQAQCPTSTEVFINEFHYDNAGNDAGEFVEVAVLNSAGVTLADITLTLYNGGGGVPYGSPATLNSLTAGMDDGTYTYYSLNLPANGLQNGSPDGFALSCGGVAFEFLSYEGSMLATSGPANGQNSTDVLATQTSNTPLGSSIQKIGSAWFATCGQNTNGDTNARPAIAVAAADAVKAEGNAGTTDFTFTVTRSGLTTGATTVNFAVTGSGANPADAADFGGLLPTGSVTFEADSTVKTVTVAVSGDADIEADEEFTLTLTDAIDCSTDITTPTATGTILDDDATTAYLEIAATDAVKAEGNAGTTAFTFTVTRTGILSGTSTADYAVTGSGADPADAADFGGVLPSGMVTFEPDSMVKTITVNVSGDVAVEPDENFTVTLSNPVNAVITTATADGTILDDDATVTELAIVATDAVKNEGNAGTTAFTFTVNRTGNISGASSVDYAVTGSGADPADAADFGGTLPSGTVNFVATQAAEVITIDVSGDFTVEPAEGFTVTLSNPVGANITTATADGSILNDDTACPTATDVFINEFHYDNTGTDAGEFVEVAVLNSFSATPLSGITLSLYNGSNGTVYNSQTLDNLTAGMDDGTYTYYSWNLPVNGLQNGAPDGFALSCAGVAFEFLSYEGSMLATAGPANGQNSTDVMAAQVDANTPLGSSVQKVAGTWYLTCGQNTNGTTNARPMLAIAAADASKAEGDAGTTDFTFTVTRSGLTSGETTVNYDVTGTGANPADAADFGGVLPSGSVTFEADSLVKTITIAVSGDTDIEPNEEFTVTLTDVTGCSTEITTGTATGTILDDDDVTACPNTLAVPGTIASGTYQAAQEVTSNGIVENGSVVSFKAGVSIELQPDFEVQTGGELEAVIEACVPGPSPVGNE